MKLTSIDIDIRPQKTLQNLNQFVITNGIVMVPILISRIRFILYPAQFNDIEQFTCLFRLSVRYAVLFLVEELIAQQNSQFDFIFLQVVTVCRYRIDELSLEGTENIVW